MPAFAGAIHISFCHRHDSLSHLSSFFKGVSRVSIDTVRKRPQIKKQRAAFGRALFFCMYLFLLVTFNDQLAENSKAEE
jgi:hypothetical protein